MKVVSNVRFHRVVTGSFLGYTKPQEEPSEPTQGDPAAKVEVISFAPPHKSRTTGTPFGGKVEAVLRLAGIPYVGLKGNVTNPKHAPKHKFPVLRHGDNTISDSTEIFKYLKNTYPDKMKMFVPDELERQHQALLLQRTLEESTYFAIVYTVWQRDDVFFQLTAPSYFKGMPPGLFQAITRLVKGSTMRDLYGQGMGRQPWQYVKARLAEELDVYDALLAKSGAYLTGATVTLPDCFLWATIEQALYSLPEKEGVDYPLPMLVRERTHLLDFHARMEKLLFPSGATDTWAETAK